MDNYDIEEIPSAPATEFFAMIDGVQVQQCTDNDEQDRRIRYST